MCAQILLSDGIAPHPIVGVPPPPRQWARTQSTVPGITPNTIELRRGGERARTVGVRGAHDHIEGPHPVHHCGQCDTESRQRFTNRWYTSLRSHLPPGWGSVLVVRLGFLIQDGRPPRAIS
ncbi:hypothetical protein Aglo01_50500 [Actinokineospora globicatena]|nr:hypothetical protein Aglo01_50500 [Actinokineospora globicatena]GLW87397.1 hypothetical protein Aglo02_50360 [Actinokineospora globicatena]